MIRALALLMAMLAVTQAHAADIAAGAAAFNRCKICHTIENGGANRVGPNLHELFGRKAGGGAGFAYSEAMKNSEMVWDEETLAKFLRDPKNSVPGNRMAFPGIKDDTELADLLAYLKQATQ
jgi:cytochrome c